jgi:hypothetical protein
MSDASLHKGNNSHAALPAGGKADMLPLRRHASNQKSRSFPRETDILEPLIFRLTTGQNPAVFPVKNVQRPKIKSLRLDRWRLVGMRVRQPSIGRMIGLTRAPDIPPLPPPSGG